jgi:hypothetical protein
MADCRAMQPVVHRDSFDLRFGVAVTVQVRPEFEWQACKT